MSSIYSKQAVGAGPYAVRWANARAVQEAHTAFARLEALLAAPLPHDEAFTAELVAAWMTVLRIKNHLTQSVRKFTWKAKEWEADVPEFHDHCGRLCTKGEALEAFFLDLPPEVVPPNAAFMQDPTRFADCWIALLNRCEPLLPATHRTYRADATSLPAEFAAA